MISELPLVGAGGEPVDLKRTLASHGVASLPPSPIDEEAWTLEVTLPSGRGARTVRVSRRPSRLRAASRARRSRSSRSSGTCCGSTRISRRSTPSRATIRQLAWAAAGAGRMLRSPTVFEDVVKTICTTNCAWSGTVRMVTALVDHLGVAAPTGERTFPTPAAMAEAGEDFYRDVARAGYRGAYLRKLADDVASGALDLEELNDPELPVDEVERGCSRSRASARTRRRT